MASWGIWGSLVYASQMRPLLQPRASGTHWALELPSSRVMVPALLEPPHLVLITTS